MGSDLGSAQGVSEHGLIGDGLSGRIERNNLHLLEPLAFLRGRFQFFLRQPRKLARRLQSQFVHSQSALFKPKVRAFSEMARFT
jgi:hypothetical protein